MSRAGLLLPVFALLAFFFGWKCFEAWTAAPASDAPGADHAASLSPVVPQAGASRSADFNAAVTAIVVRPVFRPDRRPFQESVTGTPQRNYEAELGKYTVVGVLALEGAPKAIVTGFAAGKAERYEVGPGDALPGFTVKEVRTDGVLVTADDREFTIPLYAGAPKGAVRTEPTPQRPAAVQAQPTAAPPQARPMPGAAPVPAAASAAPGPARVQPVPPAPVVSPTRLPIDRRRMRPTYTPGQGQPPNQ